MFYKVEFGQISVSVRRHLKILKEILKKKDNERLRKS